MISSLSKSAFLVAASFGLAACSAFDFFGDTPEDLLPGDRIAILVEESSLKPDEQDSPAEILLPAPTSNPEWPQAGGYANHAMHHIKVGDRLSRAWTASIGAGSDEEKRLNTQPILANGRLYTMDAETKVSAFDARSGQRQWSVELTPEEEAGEGHIGGGLAYDGGRVFVATGFAEVLALDAASGQVQWRRNIGEPMRAAPTARGNRVFVVTMTNQLLALNALTGETLWSYRAIEETTNLLGAASPAVESGVVVAAFSSGELVALRIENGRELWSDSLTVARRASSIATIAAIRGRPVIDRGIVLAISNSGLMVAVDLRSGRRIWEREIASVESPWVAGDFVFVLSSNAELAAVGRRDGRIHWVTALSLWEDPEDREGRINWTAPILASNRLIVAGSTGEALAVSPYTGQILGAEEMPDKVSIPPIVANDTIYFLSDDGDLVAYR